METQDTNNNGSQNNQPQQPQQPQQGYYQQPQQGYYQQPPQQPVYQQPVYVQPVVAQPQVVTAVPATEMEKDASFQAGGSIFMLIFAIVGTINLITGFIGNIISLSIFSLLLDTVLGILMVVGYWLVYVNSRKKKLSTKGISLIRIPYVINFVFACISFAGSFLLYCLTLQVISIIVSLITFIIQCICFSSINKTLKLARDINRNQNVVGRKAGMFAPVIMIISAVFTLIGDIVSYITYAALVEVLSEFLGESFSFITSALVAGGIMTIVVAVVAFLVGICAALVILKFNKLVRKAHGEA